jgi:hypothetical protein
MLLGKTAKVMVERKRRRTHGWEVLPEAPDMTQCICERRMHTGEIREVKIVKTLIMML